MRLSGGPRAGPPARAAAPPRRAAPAPARRRAGATRPAAAADAAGDPFGPPGGNDPFGPADGDLPPGALASGGAEAPAEPAEDDGAVRVFARRNEKDVYR